MAWYSKGCTLAELGKDEEALQAYNRAIDIKPDYSEAWNNKGITLVKLDKVEEALQAFDKAIAIKPDFYDAWYNKGIVLRPLGKAAEAQKAFRKAEQLNIMKMYGKPQPVNLLELRAGYKGSPFSQLIEHHLNRQNQDKRIQSCNGHKAMLSDEAGELAEDFIDRWNLRAHDQSFWQTDAASILDEITQDAKNILSEKDLPIDDEILLNFFNIVVLNYASSAYDQPKMREFMGIPRGQDKKG